MCSLRLRICSEPLSPVCTPCVAAYCPTAWHFAVASLSSNLGNVRDVWGDSRSSHEKELAENLNQRPHRSLAASRHQGKCRPSESITEHRLRSSASAVIVSRSSLSNGNVHLAHQQLPLCKVARMAWTSRASRVLRATVRPSRSLPSTDPHAVLAETPLAGTSRSCPAAVLGFLAAAQPLLVGPRQAAAAGSCLQSTCSVGRVSWRILIRFGHKRQKIVRPGMLSPCLSWYWDVV